MSSNRSNVALTNKEVAKSVFAFVINSIILIALAVGLTYWGGTLDTEGGTPISAGSYYYVIFCALLCVVIMYFYFFFENRSLLASGSKITMIFAAMEVYLSLAFLVGYYVNIYARPVALVALLIVLLVGRKEAVFVNIICSLIVFMIDNLSLFPTRMECYTALLIGFSAGTIAAFLAEGLKTRLRAIGVGAFIVIPIILIIFLLEVSTLTDGTEDGGFFERVVTNMGYGLFGGLSSAVLFLAFLPIFELLFNCLTAFRLRELTSPDAKLLKRLSERAQGTFNHSMIVAQIAEACAARLGEDVACARAAAFYHDVGKLHQPDYFTENQSEYNPHDELTPELSADIIRSHVRDGYELIKANRLPKILADVALEHHGTMPIRYFYAKALKMTDGDLNIEDFSYPGPKPKTKIAAIIMIADASEAAVRSLPNRSPEATEKVVREIIEERMDLEQFADCDITMADLTAIRHTIVSTLTGTHHHRIKYPSIKYRKTDDGTKGENV